VKANELRDLPVEELMIKLDEAKEEFFNLRFQSATGQLDNFNQLGQVKREIARIETITRERELGIEVEITQAEAMAPERKRKWRNKPVEDVPEAEASPEPENKTDAPAEVVTERVSDD